MKPISTLAAIATVALLSACMSDGNETASSEPRKTTAVDALIGKRLVNGDVTFIINADGTMGGNIKGEKIVGTYKATATESCSTFTAPQNLTGREFCSTPVISGDTVVFNRRDGSNSPTYKING